MDTKEFKQMLDRTQFAIAAVYPSAKAQSVTQQRRFQLCAWGSYPAARANMALGFSKDWKKMRSTNPKATYWYSAVNGISLVLEANRAVVLSGTPAYPVAAPPGLSPPEGFNNFQKGSIVSCWVNDPGPLINQKLKEIGIPVDLPADELFISLFPAEKQQGQYEAILQIQVSSALLARGVVTAIGFAISFARAFMPVSSDDASNGPAVLASILFANWPEQDGNKIIIRSGVLSMREISLLFTMFSVP
jgi:hypothetical protein